MPKAVYPCRGFLIVQQRRANHPIIAPVPMVLSYSTEEPYTVEIRVASGRSVGLVARQQLLAGMFGPSCTPAVSVIPLLINWVEITVRHKDNRSVRLAFHNDDITHLLHVTQHLVPIGDELEHLDLDAELASLVDGEAAA